MKIYGDNLRELPSRLFYHEIVKSEIQLLNHRTFYKYPNAFLLLHNFRCIPMKLGYQTVEWYYPDVGSQIMGFSEDPMHRHV